MRRTAALAALIIGCGNEPAKPSAATGADATPALDAVDADVAVDSNVWLPGEQVYEARVPLETVAPGVELSNELARSLTNEADLWVYAIEWVSPKGLHHSRLDAVNPLSSTPNPILSLPVQDSVGMFRAPEGFAIKLTKQQPLSVSYHYLNTTKSPIAGEILVRVHALPRDAAAPMPLGYFWLLNFDLTLPPRAVTAATMTCRLTRDVIIHDVMSHAHALGRGVHAEVIGGAHDGLVLYKSTNWENSPTTRYAPALSLKAGDAIRVTCDYENTSDVTVKSGAKASDEMCGIAMRYSGDAFLAMGKATGGDCLPLGSESP